MAKRIITAICIFALIAGAAIFLLPSFKTAAYLQQADKEIQRFEEAIADVSPEEPAETEPPRILPELWEACNAYNEQIYAENQEGWTEVSQKQAPFDPAEYGWTDDCFGILTIPDADISYPIYLGASSDNLLKGASVLGQTSMPIGGKNTHCVIAGHRSWNGTIMFRSLEDLTEGSTIQITNPWETLTYTVQSVRVANPKKSDELMIQEGSDLLTIFTCSYPNSRRVIVTCERSDDIE